MTIPAGTQTGKSFRLRGKGVRPARGGVAGDLLCRVIVETPVNLSREQKETFEAMREGLEGGRHSPRRSGWFDTVKSFFDNLRP